VFGAFGFHRLGCMLFAEDVVMLGELIEELKEVGELETNLRVRSICLLP